MTEDHKPQKWGRIITNLILGCFAFSVFSVVLHRFAPVPVTFLMVSRLLEGEGLDARWRLANFIDDDLKTSVIAAEDAKFCSHDGFDFEAIKKAQHYNKTHKKQRGASTLSQQTAKNVFLWPQRSYVRKGFEVYYTFLIENLWPKSRIIGVYLNVAEWGPGVYGAEAAAHYWFDTSAATLSERETSRLAAILPSPRKWKAEGSGRYVKRRSGKIAANANVVERGGIDECAVD